MITAKNYAAQAEVGMRKLHERAKAIMPADADHMLASAGLIKTAQHFALPDGGVLFDSRGKSMRGISLRLPYPVITFEYFDDVAVAVEANETKINRHVSVAMEVPVQALEYVNPNFKENTDSDFLIILETFMFSEEYKVWFPCPLGCTIPCNWDAFEKVGLVPGYDAPKDHSKILIEPFVAYPMMMEERRRLYGNAAANQSATNEITHEVTVLMELLEALACSNVEETVFQEARSKHSAITSKIPKYVTKILTLKASSPKPQNKEHKGGTHASPIMHLRRGHIRRLPDGRTIWVNSCVVGKKENGYVDKKYEVTT